jgi:hypothetical protein
MFPRFDRRFFAGDETFTCVGSGALGGKALGLALARDTILSGLGPGAFPEISVVLPRLTVICTNVFDAFMERNHLAAVSESGAPDHRIAHAFQLADLPVELVGDLRGLIEQVHTPLAIRSSSLLEDALAHPFAGVYATKMIPNNQHAADARFSRLVEAIKFVYASAFFASARSYRDSVDAPPASEKMAVIIQEVVGQRHGDRFYPEISGVARSYDYYPGDGSGPSGGVASLALGLGKTIVDGGLCWTYSPERPAAPPPFGSIKDLLTSTQTRFWAVNMGPPPPYDPLRETEYLVHSSIEDARPDKTLDLVASTYDAASDRVRPGTGGAGPLVLDFALLLRTGILPVNECVKRLLAVFKETVGQDVEIEFAFTRSRDPEIPSRLGFLQVRPMATPGAAVEVTVEDLTAQDVVLASTNCLGNGRVDTIHDVVFLRPDVFDAKHTQAMAAELAAINHDLVKDGRRYLLIGFGRWGSSEPWLGVPVVWGQISGAGVIVEASRPGMSPDMSQGSHFFHNLIGLHVLYLSLPEGSGPPVDWEWLDQQETVQETGFVKHVRTRSPLRIQVDGRSRRGVVARGEGTRGD